MTLMTAIAADTAVTCALPGLAEGTDVLTLTGALPVENLAAGMRIITRNGVRQLKAIHSRAGSGRMVRISASALGVDQPAEDLHLDPHSRILIRDWRARALKGCDQAVMSASKLVDGEYIRLEERSLRLFSLEFDGPEVIYAGGLELAIAPPSA